MSNCTLNRADLHPYQNRLVEFINDKPKCAAWVDMGLGKTVSTLTSIVDLFDDFAISKVLIIAPLRVAVSTWPNEIKQWEHTRNIDFEVLTGGPKKRQERADGRHRVHIINRENVVWLVKHFGKAWPYDMIVIDESSSFKNPQSKRFKALRKVLPYVDRLVELTGTPASNGLLDLWSQVYLLDQGERLGRTMTSYKNTHFDSDYLGYTFTPKPGANDAIYEAVNDLCLTLSAEDYIELPGRVDNPINVALPAAKREQYLELEKEFLIELSQTETVVASSTAVLSNKLRQVCNGAMYTEDGVFEVHDEKLDALGSIIEEAQGEPVLVAYNFKSDVERITKKFKNAVVLDKSPATIAKWNRGEIPILLAHPASAGHGLNLQKGGRIAAWFGLEWSLELYEQFNARLHRQGQTKPVIIHHIMIEDSIEQRVFQALQDKSDVQNALLEATKKEA